MDLHFHGPDATLTERSVVDSVLGLPPSEGPGGLRITRDEGHHSLVQRSKLLPAFHAVQNRFGWIPPGAMDYICRRLSVPPAEAHGVASFYHMFTLKSTPPTVVHVCDDVACRIKGSEGLCTELQHALGAEGWKRSPCLGQCERAPAALVVRAGETPSATSVAPANSQSLLAARAADLPASADTRESIRASVPQFGSDNLRLLSRVGRVNPCSLEAYQASGGYSALTKGILQGPEAVIAEVMASKLMGRGGAAFPTGRKWEAVAKAPARPHYVVCNADESEPGTFKDRVLMEGDPFAVIEGMTIAGLATGSEQGYLYIRGEYPQATERLKHALEAARAAHLLGPKILGSSFSFDIELRSGAGAYICGEETALFNSIEGKRGEPRNKPPFPVHVGLFGKPTVINNVETLVNIPQILALGGEAYSRIGTAGSAGPKLFCVSGHVTRPGVYEVDFGITLGQLIQQAGGVAGGKAIRAVLLGGAAGSFVGPDQLNIPLSFEGTRAAGASLGSGVVLVFDESVDLADILLRIAAFFRDESCGQCVPCRVGTVRQEELLHRLRSGKPMRSYADELELLKEIGQVMRDASICGLGQAASNAVESAFATLNPMPKVAQIR